MSKIDKNIQDARGWLVKHETEAAADDVKKALALWESKVKLADAARTQWEAAKEAAIAARKGVAQALKGAKVSRKAQRKSATTPSTPVEAASPKPKAPARKKAAPQA